MPRSLLIIAAGACSLAAGCCCPALSGRYYEAGLAPPESATCDATGAAGKSANEACACSPRHRHGRLGHGWLGRGRHEAVPSQQQYDYLSPLPKFHPAPTHPVFEPQAHYLPPSDPAPPPRGVASETHGK